MVNFKINHKTAFEKVLLLTVCSLFSFNNAQAGKFKEIPINEKEVILQFDDDEGRREAGATIEIGKIDRVIKELDESIQINAKKGYKIIGVDFSNSDLTNEKFEKINLFIKNKGINLDYNLDETDINLFGEPSIIKKMNIYEEETEDSLEIKQKMPQNYKFELLRSIKIPQNKGKLYEDNDSDSD